MTDVGQVCLYCKVKIKIMFSFGEYLGMRLKDHVSIYHEKAHYLYDPDGGYQPTSGYLSDHISEELLVYEKYLDYHRKLGSVEVLTFSLKEKNADKILSNMREMPPSAGSFMCAASISQVISGIGPFSKVTLQTGVTRPQVLYDELQGD